jgi:transposase
MKISVLGIDLGKHVFHVHGVDEQGRRVLQKKFSRAKLWEFMGRLEPCLVGMEACGGAHQLGRTFQGYGHEVRLMHPSFVKAYVKSNKNDYWDAEAICEAVTRPTMRLVPIKSVAQQDLQSLHRLRRLAVGQRTAQVNQIRGLLLEYGIVVPQGLGALRQQLPLLLADGENGLTPTFRELLQLLYEELVHVDERIQRFDRLIAAQAQQDERCQRLLTIPGIGVLIASALVAAIGDGRQFNNARELAAWLGLVPRQSATGGQIRLLGRIFPEEQASEFVYSFENRMILANRQVILPGYQGGLRSGEFYSQRRQDVFLSGIGARQTNDLLITEVVVL